MTDAVEAEAAAHLSVQGTCENTLSCSSLTGDSPRQRYQTAASDWLLF
jgi:hypothetical protein